MSEPNKIPTEFFKIMKEFTNDILTSFPEYKDTLDKGLMDILFN